MSNYIVILRIRSTIDANPKIKTIFKLLRLKTVNSLTVVSDTPSTRGFLEKIKTHSTWSFINQQEVLKFEFKTISLKNSFGKKSTLDRVLRLHPPRGGYKSIKLEYPRGALGHRPEIWSLLERMKWSSAKEQ